MRNSFSFLILGVTLSCCIRSNETTKSDIKLKALIIDGQNSHYIWPKTTFMLKDYLIQTGLFEVDIARISNVWLGIKYNSERPEDLRYFYFNYSLETNSEERITDDPISDSSFNPDFKSYDVVILNVGFQCTPWSDLTKSNLVKYMRDGGGLVVVHSANNAWGDWDEFNKMIGIGGWGGRDSTFEQYVYYDDNGKLHKDNSTGICGSHGLEHEYFLEIREKNHPITRGLPSSWLHAQDELYDRLRGPAENLTVLATAYSDIKKNAPPWNQNITGTGRHEPMLMTINYHSGRVFHTALGHWDYSMECVGFIVTFQRGSEWAATGKVTQKLPDDFPTGSNVRTRNWNMEPEVR